jgi:small subunit ribosomal protein S6
MRKYELMMIVDPAMADDARSTLLSEVKAELTTHGVKNLAEDLLGLKKFAYKVNASENGFYVLYTFEFDGRGFFEITKDFNLKKSIWRHMFVRIEDAKMIDAEVVDYKNTEFLRKYITKFNKIVPRQYSGVPLKNQKILAQAIKRARLMAFLPYVLDLKKKIGE